VLQKNGNTRFVMRGSQDVSPNDWIADERLHRHPEARWLSAHHVPPHKSQKLTVALRIELWQHGVLTGGVEECWDAVESALDVGMGEYPILDSVSPYGELVVAHGRLADLADESRRLAATTTGQVHALLLKIANLCEQASAATDAELRFNGDYRACLPNW
jgi:hypothetical protein